jgi:arylsulfatase A-like enzyme
MIFSAEQVRAPNFLFILVDDLGYMDIGANNPDTFYDTPNVNRLPEQGMRFPNAYTAGPVYSPTRASILTGKYPARLGITDYIHQHGRNQPDKWKRKTALLPARYHDRLDLEEMTLAEALKDAGYVTFFAGKWDLGPEGFWPGDQGFDVNKGGTDRGGPYEGNKYFSPYRTRLEDGPEGEHLPDRLATETIKFITDNQVRPFFTFLAFYSVHVPLLARNDLEKKYLRKRQNGPVDSWGQEGSHKVRQVQNHAVYAGMVEAMDLAMGRVLDALTRLN